MSECWTFNEWKLAFKEQIFWLVTDNYWLDFNGFNWLLARRHNCWNFNNDLHRLMPASNKVSIRFLLQHYAQGFSILVIFWNSWVNWGNEAESWSSFFIELLNNVGLGMMNDQGKTLLKSRIADDSSTK